MNELAAFAARGDKPIAGTVTVGDGEPFDVGEALEEGGGTIVVLAGSNLERALDGYHGVKSTSVPKGAKAINAKEDGPAVVKASDSAKDKAAALGVDLSKVEGTGKNGAIKVEDVEEAAAAADAGGTSSGGGD